MKRGTHRHPKMIALAAELEIPLPHAIGILDLLWEFTAANCPRGDIGSLPDREIAKAVEWKRRPTVLVEALCKCRWLERDEKYRLIVHDWPDHALSWVKKQVTKNGKGFLPNYGVTPELVQSCPPDSGVSFDDDKGERDGSPRQSGIYTKLSSTGKTSNPEKTSPRARREIVRSETAWIEPMMDELVEIYRQGGAPIAEKHKLLSVQLILSMDPVQMSRVPVRLPNYCKWAFVSGKWSEPSKTKSLINVLRDGDWDVEITQRTLPMARASPRKSVIEQAEERFTRRMEADLKHDERK